MMDVRTPETCMMMHGTTKFKLIFEYFSKICPENSSFTKTRQEWRGTSHEDICTFMILSRRRMRNVLDKSCVENQETHFTLSKFCLFRKSCRLWYKCGRIWYSQTGYKWQYNTAHAHCMLDTECYKHTNRIYNTHCFSTVTMVRRTRLCVVFICTLPVLLVHALKNFLCMHACIHLLL
jgi:hypothetical protein